MGGIRSTGLSAALGIATRVFHEYADAGLRQRPLQNPLWPKVPGIAETSARDWQQADNGGIVCHCELVTRREIEQALQAEIAPGSLAELKRRTRATMGRCQGFYCSAELSELTAGQFTPALGEKF